MRKVTHPHFYVDGVEHKKCSGCGGDFPLSNFWRTPHTWDKLNYFCRTCAQERDRARYSKRKDNLLRGCKVRYQNKKEIILARNREWIKNNKESNDKYKSEWQRANREKRNKRLMERYYDEPNYRLAVLLRSRLLRALKNNQKTGSTLTLLGCSIQFLREYLESMFSDGMTWENHGNYWHIDHIRPCATYDLSDPRQLSECFHYTNMQPLLAVENMRKKARWEFQDA